MNDSYDPKSKFSKFMEGKGFYLALAVCVIGAGTAAWVAVDKTINRMEQSGSSVQEQSYSSTVEPSYGFPDLEEAGKAQSGVNKSESSSAPASSSTAPASSSKEQAASAAPSEPAAEAKAQPEPQPSSFVLPISGEIFGPYSNGELVKNTTLKEWRTHDGIDIKADKGSPVKAACDGKVTAVRDDPLNGMTVEILHHDEITSIYCGLDKKLSIKEGDTVKVGQPIGTIGEIPCEIALDPHLHFAIKVAGAWADPLKVMGKTAS